MKLRILFFALLFFPFTAFAKLECMPIGKPNPSIPAKPIAQLLEMSMYQMGDLPGLLVGVVKNKKTQLFTCGETAKSSGQRPDGNTVWQIGSVSKVITTTIFSMMINENKVHLADPLSDYMPSGVSVPSFQGRQITLMDLATHTAGFPREVSGLNQGSGYQTNESFDSKRAYKWLSQYQLTVAPGTHYQYSNIGFGLLGNSLARREKTTYGDLVQRYINQGLGMHDTTVTPSKAQKAREAKSYWMNGDLIKKDWAFNFDRPSGGVYSTGNDLLKFIQYSLNLLPMKSAVANQLAHATYVHRENLDNKLTFADSGMALGWSVDEPYNGMPLMLHKNGWVSGFNTWVILVPSQHIGIFSISSKPYLAVKDPLSSAIRILMAS